jgi:hypothetical protein
VAVRFAYPPLPPTNYMAMQADGRNGWLILLCRRVRNPRQHHLPPTRHRVVPRRKLQIRTRPLYLRYRKRVCEVLQGPAETSQEAVHWRGAGEGTYTAVPAECRPQTPIEYASSRYHIFLNCSGCCCGRGCEGYPKGGDEEGAESDGWKGVCVPGG